MSAWTSASFCPKWHDYARLFLDAWRCFNCCWEEQSKCWSEFISDFHDNNTSFFYMVAGLIKMAWCSTDSLAGVSKCFFALFVIVEAYSFICNCLSILNWEVQVPTNFYTIFFKFSIFKTILDKTALSMLLLQYIN